MDVFTRQLEKHGIDASKINQFADGENIVLFPDWVNTGRTPKPYKLSLWQRFKNFIRRVSE